MALPTANRTWSIPRTGKTSSVTGDLPPGDAVGISTPASASPLGWASERRRADHSVQSSPMARSTTGHIAQFDELDARLVALFAEQPRIGVLECARRLGVARGTVQARLDRMQDRGIIRGFGPELDPAALGYEVTAFVTLEIRQGSGHEAAAAHLAAIPEVLELHTV